MQPIQHQFLYRNQHTPIQHESTQVPNQPVYNFSNTGVTHPIEQYKPCRAR